MVILGTSVMLLFEGQYRTLQDEASHERFGGNKLAKFSFFLLFALAAGNAVTTLLECGPLICDDPPTDYKLLEELKTE
jgi:hypothetical protein